MMMPPEDVERIDRVAHSIAEDLPSFVDVTLNNVRIDFASAVGLANAITVGGNTGTGNRNLEMLWLNGNGLGDDGLAALSRALANGRCAGLRRLYVTKNDISDEGVCILLQALERRFTTTDAAPLRELWLNSNRVGSAGAERLARALVLREGEGRRRRPRGGLSELRDLRLNQNVIGDGGAMALAAALDPFAVTAAYGRSARVSVLTSLHIRHNGVSDVGARAFVKALRSNDRVLVLTVSQNKGMSEEVEDKINAAARRNRSLIKTDDVSSRRENFVASLREGDAGGKSASSPSSRGESPSDGGEAAAGEDGSGGGALSSSTSSRDMIVHQTLATLSSTLLPSHQISELRLINDSLNRPTLFSLCDALRETSHPIELLWLSNNGDGIGDPGAAALAVAAGTLPGLTRLYVTKNGVGDDGARAIAEDVLVGARTAATAGRSVLMELNLSNNRIGDDGATAIANALEKCPSLEFLGLNQNNIGDAGGAQMGYVLSGYSAGGAAAKSSSSIRLRYLGLKDNRITDVGGCSLSICVSVNGAAAPKVLVEGNPMSSELQSQIGGGSNAGG